MLRKLKKKKGGGVSRKAAKAKCKTPPPRIGAALMATSIVIAGPSNKGQTKN